MKTITFYSYKGGVGRTLAAANFAVYLAKLGLKTVLIDFDLEAPGLDAKFPFLKLPIEQQGILDYILEYQNNNQDPGNVKNISIPVPIASSNNNIPLWLIPAGQYLSEEYYRNLSLLDWSLIFSEQRNGVAFFQQFIARIEKEFQADFVIIDSRTGFTEIAGLCTQQLADEVVMLSSLSSESINVTKHIKQLIQQSKFAKLLDKSIDVKIVVSRVPKPQDLDDFKKLCSQIFDINKNKLFFLFSCPSLEIEEFLAVINSDKNQELLSNYVQLFYNLDLKIATKYILTKIENQVGNILSFTQEEVEKRILELAVLYPHPECYRTAMRYFRLLKKEPELKTYAYKILELIPNDEETQEILAKIYLADLNKTFSLNEFIQHDNIAMKLMDSLWQRGDLNPKEINLYASFLENSAQFSKSLEVALTLCDNENIDDKTRTEACCIAYKSAVKLNHVELADKLKPKNCTLNKGHKCNYVLGIQL